MQVCCLNGFSQRYAPYTSHNMKTFHALPTPSAVNQAGDHWETSKPWTWTSQATWRCSSSVCASPRLVKLNISNDFVLIFSNQAKKDVFVREYIQAHTTSACHWRAVLKAGDWFCRLVLQTGDWFCRAGLVKLSHCVLIFLAKNSGRSFSVSAKCLETELWV